MRTLIEQIDIYGFDGPGEAVVLVASLALALVLLWRVCGPGFAVPTVAFTAAAFAVIGHVAIPVTVAGLALVLAARVRGRPRAYPAPFVPYMLQLVVVLGGLVVYTTTRMHIESAERPAVAHANSIIGAERALGLYFEPHLQDLVLRSSSVTQFLNGFYTWGFLAITVCALLWLYIIDRANYRLFRNCLGISVLLAVLTIAMFPVAPPRLVADSGLIDTVVHFGRARQFANEYAAVPSLHVGWLFLAGFVLARSVGGRRGLLLGAIPGPLMSFVVVVTGNHYWIDGVIGTVFCLVPAVLLTRPTLVAALRQQGSGLVRAMALVARATHSALRDNRRISVSVLPLAGLLIYLLAEQVTSPGFTKFWWYLVFQMAATVILLLVGEVIFAKQGGLSWVTHVVAVGVSYADVLGTDGNLYARIDEYDKLTHFAGVAAVTSGLYDCFRGLARGRPGWSADARAWLAVLLGFLIGVGWEVYEFLGDRVFHTLRQNGWWDTSNDVISDTAGAVLAAAVLWMAETGRVPGRRRAEAPNQGPRYSG